jgi:hypothetical protein
VFTASLPSNRRSIVACACVVGMCLPTRCLAMGIHVTAFKAAVYRIPCACSANFSKLKFFCIGIGMYQRSDTAGWTSEIILLAGAGIFFCHLVHTGSETQSAGGMKISTDLRLVPRLGMLEALSRLRSTPSGCPSSRTCPLLTFLVGISKPTEVHGGNCLQRYLIYFFYL